jgi:cell division protein FtsB
MKFYWPLLLALIMYTALSFFWGRSGMQAQKELISIRTELQKNLDELNRINRTLNDELNALGSDPESIIIQSRNLSYHEADEKLLFVNLPESGLRKIDAGKFLNLHWVERAEDNLFKGISLLVFLSSSLIVILVRRNRKTL